MKSRLSLAACRCALLVIDLQEEQRADATIAAENLTDVLQGVGRLLQAARSHGIPVFHAGYVRDFSLVPARPFEPVHPDGSARFSDRNNPMVAFCAEVAPGPGEDIILKNDASAFEEVSLADRLHALDTEWLIVVGVWTEQCVAASVRDAMAEGFRVLLVKDACTSGTTAMHQTAILNLSNRLYGGAVADVERTIRLTGGQDADVWRTDVPCPIRYTLETVASHFDAL